MQRKIHIRDKQCTKQMLVQFRLPNNLSHKDIEEYVQIIYGMKILQ